MAQVSIIRHQPAAVFSTPVEVIIVDDKQNLVRIVEPSGNVGTQYPKARPCQPATPPHLTPPTHLPGMLGPLPGCHLAPLLLPHPVQPPC